MTKREVKKSQCPKCKGTAHGSPMEVGVQYVCEDCCYGWNSANVEKPMAKKRPAISESNNDD